VRATSCVRMLQELDDWLVHDTGVVFRAVPFFFFSFFFYFFIFSCSHSTVISSATSKPEHKDKV
jgi:hypothetical protein